MFHGHPRQKLLIADIIAIKSAESCVRNEELAHRYNVTGRHIYTIRVGKTWKHVRPDLTKDPKSLYR